MMRLASEQSALPRETQTALHIPRVEAHPIKRDKLLEGLRASDRVKASVKEKSDDELLNH
jgi:ATP-dependent DNA helicase RecG